MHTINGFVIIATAENEMDFVILAARKDNNGFEYVTARMVGLTESEWFWGRYYRSFDEAVDNFRHRRDKA